MHRDPMQPLWFNFGDLGYPGWTPVTQFECGLLLAGAERMIDHNGPELCHDLVQRTRHELLQQAVQGQVEDHWVSQAVLITALTGLLGYEIPEIKTWEL